MRLCNFTVRIEIPDHLTVEKQDHALDAVDELDLPRLIETIVRDRLRRSNPLKHATAVVET